MDTLAEQTSVGPRPVAPERDRVSAAEGTPILPLLICIAVGIAAAHLLVWVLSLFFSLPMAIRAVIQALLMAGLLAAVVHRFCMAPLLTKRRELEQQTLHLQSRQRELELHLAHRDAEVAEARTKLNAALAARQAAEAEVRQLGAQRDQRVNERTANLDATIRRLTGDVAEANKTSEALRESEKRLQRLVEMAPDGIWTVNAEGKTNFINRGGAALLGYAVPEMLGRPPGDFIVQQDLPRPMQDFVLPRNGEIEPFECRMRRKDEHELWARTSITAIIDEGGQDLGTLILFADCTARKRHEQRLQQQAELLDVAQDAILICDANLHIVSWNQGAAELYGWNAEDVLSREYFDLLAKESSSADRDEVLKALRETGRWRGELCQTSKSGRQITVDARLSMPAVSPGSQPPVLVLATDATERRVQAARCLREQRMETASTLASGLAHELNNSLAPILLSAQMLRSKLQDPADQDLLATIEARTERSAEFIKQVLTFARGIEGERIAVQPSRLIEEMIAIARETFPRNIHVLADVQNGIWNIRGDATQLHQVLLKLCVNARDAMAAGGLICLRAKNARFDGAAGVPGEVKPGAWVQIEVQDSGPGIPAAIQDRIFEPFFSTRERFKMNGLGLSTVLGIVRSHGGSIQVQSQPGAGATFSVFLPAMESTPEIEQIVEASEHQGELILLVEDDASLRDVTRAALRHHGYEVLAVSDSLEALGLLAQQNGRVKLVLTNMVMPSMDGPSLARAARKIDPHIRIIASSPMGGGLGHKDKLAALQTLGISRLLAKPYHTRELLRAVRDELSHGDK